MVPSLLHQEGVDSILNFQQVQTRRQYHQTVREFDRNYGHRTIL